MALTKNQNTFLASLTVYPSQDQPGEGRRRPCLVTNSHLLRRFLLLLRLSFPSVVLRNFIKSGDRSSPHNLYFIFWFKHLNCTCLLLFFLCAVYHPSLKQRKAAGLMFGTSWGSRVQKGKEISEEMRWTVCFVCKEQTSLRSPKQLALNMSKDNSLNHIKLLINYKYYLIKGQFHTV